MSHPSSDDTSPAVKSPVHDAPATDHIATTKWMGAFKAFSAVFRTIAKYRAPLAGFALVYTALYIASYIVYGADQLTIIRNTFSGKPPESNWFDYVPLAVSLLLIIPNTKLALAIADRRDVQVREIFAIRPLQLLWVVISLLLMFLAYFFGALLFLIPLIFIIPWFSMVTFAIVDRNDGPLKAIRTSYRLTGKHLDDVWGVIGVTILFYIPAVLTMFIPIAGEVIASLYAVIAFAALAFLYRWLTANINPDVKPSPQDDDTDEDW